MALRPTRRGTVGFLAILLGLFLLGWVRRQHGDPDDVHETHERTEASALPADAH